MILLIELVVWWAIGFSGFVYWWTTEADLLPTDAMFGVVAGLTGPLAWLLGWVIHGHHATQSVWIGRRK